MADKERTFKDMLESFANEDFYKLLCHKDYSKCGICQRQHLQYVLAKKYLAQGKTSPAFLSGFFDEVEMEWKKTEVYLKVQSFLKKGMPLEEALKKVEAEGFIP